MTLQPYAWAPSSPFIHRSATGMRSRHQVLQDSISQVRPLLKKAWHREARSAAISSCRGAIVLRILEGIVSVPSTSKHVDLRDAG